MTSRSNAQSNLPQRILDKIPLYRALFPTVDEFIQEYKPTHSSAFLQLGLDSLIVSESYPTLLVSKAAFGEAAVKTVLKSHLFELSRAVGVTASKDAVDAIADDILSGFSDLRMTEIILAFRMMRESRFREGSNQERDACQFYGVLSSQVICNCLHRYRHEYRNPVITRYEEQQRRERLAREESQAATPEQRNSIIAATCIQQCEVNLFFNKFFTPKEMANLQYFVQERKMHLLLRQRVKEFLAEASKVANCGERMQIEAINIPTGTIDFSRLTKAIEYLDTNFPADKEFDDPV